MSEKAAKPIMKADECASYLCMTKKTFYRMVKMGNFPAGIRWGKYHVWFKDQLDKALETMKKASWEA